MATWSSMPISGGQANKILNAGSPASVFPATYPDLSKPYVVPTPTPQPGDPKSVPLKDIQSVLDPSNPLPWNQRPTPIVDNNYVPTPTMDLSQPPVTPTPPSQPGDPQSVPLKDIQSVLPPTPQIPPTPGYNQAVANIGQELSGPSGLLQGTPWNAINSATQQISGPIDHFSTNPLTQQQMSMMPDRSWLSDMIRPDGIMNPDQAVSGEAYNAVNQAVDSLSTQPQEDTFAAMSNGPSQPLIDGTLWDLDVNPIYMPYTREQILDIALQAGKGSSEWDYYSKWWNEYDLYDALWGMLNPPHEPGLPDDEWPSPYLPSLEGDENIDAIIEDLMGLDIYTINSMIQDAYGDFDVHGDLGGYGPWDPINDPNAGLPDPNTGLAGTNTGPEDNSVPNSPPDYWEASIRNHPPANEKYTKDDFFEFAMAQGPGGYYWYYYKFWWGEEELLNKYFGSQSNTGTPNSGGGHY